MEFEQIEPITLTIDQTIRVSGMRRSKIYTEIAAGNLEAVKDGVRTLIVFASLKRRMANLPRVGRDISMRVPSALRRGAA